MNAATEFVKRGVLGSLLVDQRFEGTTSTRIAMRVARAGRVEAARTLAMLDARGLLADR